MLACDSSIAPHDFASDKSYFGQMCLARGALAVSKILISSVILERRFLHEILNKRIVGRNFAKKPWN
jgi:hypothetical protein